MFFSAGELSESDEDEDDDDTDDGTELSAANPTDLSMSEDVESTGELDSSESDGEPSKDEAPEETVSPANKSEKDTSVLGEKSKKKHRKRKKEKADSKKKSGSKKLKTKKLKSVK